MTDTAALWAWGHLARSTVTTALRPNQFRRIAALAKERWGLHLTEKKTALVQNRMAKHVVRSEFESLEDYIRHLSGDPSEQDLLEFFDLLSTNTTSFFRESPHFDFLAEQFYPGLCASGASSLRIWSAACSNGAEPYSIVMHAEQQLKSLDSWDIRVLATDLSASALKHAKRGVYQTAALEGVPETLQRNCFVHDGEGVRIADRLRRVIAFHQLNLMDAWPMKGPFDVIFLRNVMIYFDPATRERLVSRMHSLLRPGGYLIVGSAESISGFDASFRTAQPAVYEKIGGAA